VELRDILALSDFLPSISSLLVRIVETTLECPDAMEDFRATYANSAWVLGACMQALAKSSHTTQLDMVDLASWTKKSVVKWGWSENVLAGLVAVLHNRCARFSL
jgi:U3 small nucleolar RNA-associated protein 20